jgi:hypothetical protein
MIGGLVVFEAIEERSANRCGEGETLECADLSALWSASKPAKRRQPNHFDEC